ncbi:hypothetical protein K1719_027646 [Acacia pycnantha]|nr:hypothetical protein K1719_027646 [Acacia pycnantha]
MAMISCSYAQGWTYDVFLSFRGTDTRRSFTGFLYHALCQKGINAFIDDEELKRGEEISPSLLKAIEESRISIIIFSENYASSTWCLEELVKIVDCMKVKGQLVLPVFHYVDPSVVRHQKGSFGVAMAKHEDRFKNNMEKVQKWKLALFKAANLSGWSLENGYEFELIQKIVEEVSGKLNQTLMHIAEYPVGLDTRLSEVNSLLHMEPGEHIRMIGIYGFGGIGKTTIARALFNLIANQFAAACFLADIRESSNQPKGLVLLQEALLFDLVGDKKIKLGNIYKGIPILKKRLCCKKILLILDDVDKLEQLQALAGGRDWFGAGSVIVITTRDKHLLATHQIEKTYQVKKLHHSEAFELFSWNAFKRKSPNSSYFEISHRVALYAEGLPLALKVMGSNLFGKTVEEWQDALDKYEKIPNKEVQNVLRVTYDNLEENEREIFLDIACFFKGETIEYVEKTLKACGFYPKFGISVLIDRSLITIDEYNRLRMHDLIQDMGREVVREDSPLEPGNRSRIWYPEDVFEVLTQNTGSSKIQGMMVDLPDHYMVHLTASTFKRMRNMKILIVKNAHIFGSPQHLPNNLRLLDWTEYPSSSLPSNFHPRKLVVLNLSRSCFTMKEPFKYLDSLTSMDLSHCDHLTKLPNMSGAPNLTELNLDYCANLEEVHDSIGFLDKLVELRASGCTKLRAFPHVIRLPSLKNLILIWCSSIQRFPDILGKMENLVTISIENSGIEELPISIGNLSGLQELCMTSCLSLKELPENLDMLQNLRNLDIEGCPQLRNFLKKLKDMGQLSPTFHNVDSLNLENCGLLDEDLPIILHSFPKLTSLDLSRNKFILLPLCIQEFLYLQLLHLHSCKFLQEIPSLPPNLQFINASSCASLNAKSSNLLLSQETFQERELHVMVPGASIPKWFDLCNKGEYMTFWVREKFPVVALCYVFAVEGEMNKGFSFEVHFFIDGEELFELEIPTSFSKMVTDHVWLFDLRTLPPFQGNPFDSYLGDNWNQVEISCDKVSEVPNVTVSFCGIHVSKQGENSVRFTDPYLDSDSITESDNSETEWKILTSNDKSVEDFQDFKDHLEACEIEDSKMLDFWGNGIKITKDDDEMEAFYASLDAETFVPLPSKDVKSVSELKTDIKPSEEIQKAWKTFQEFLTKDFSEILEPKNYSTMKATLDYLSGLSADDGVSVEMRSVIIEVSREFTHWSWDYSNASKKMEITEASMLKVHEIAEGLEANKSHFKEVMTMKSELQSQLAYLEERKKELEDQINAIKSDINAFESANKIGTKRKREIFEEGKLLKAQRDELREQLPRLRDDWALAEEIQTNINIEWSKLGEKINNKRKYFLSEI